MTAFVTIVRAADFKPAVVYGVGGKFDKAFNEGIYNGVKRFSEETGVEVMEFELRLDIQREGAFRRMAGYGATVILGGGFTQAAVINRVAAAFPDVKFAAMGVNWLDQPNLRQYVFRSDEGSYLVGIAAAMASKTGKVGFIGGMDIQTIRKFACGYIQGVKSVDANIEILQDIIGSTLAAWNDPARGAELARSQIDRGADVIYHAAGATGIGIITAVAEAGKLVIGVDSNQNHLAPNFVLTSMLKRVDVAAYNTLKDAQSGNFETGIKVLGLAEGGVDWALDEHNASLVSVEMKTTIEKAKAAIIADEIKIHGLTSNGQCPQ